MCRVYYSYDGFFTISENEPENKRMIEIKQREKAQKLKEALEPKSLDEIRKERAEKRARGKGLLQSMHFSIA